MGDASEAVFKQWSGLRYFACLAWIMSGTLLLHGAKCVAWNTALANDSTFVLQHPKCWGSAFTFAVAGVFLFLRSTVTLCVRGGLIRYSGLRRVVVPFESITRIVSRGSPPRLVLYYGNRQLVLTGFRDFQRLVTLIIESARQYSPRVLVEGDQQRVT